MDTVEKLALFGFQCFRRTDIGQNHAFFDNFVSIKALAKVDGGHLARIGQDNFALWKVQIEGAAAGAFFL